jgi:hypothetical protein
MTGNSRFPPTGGVTATLSVANRTVAQVHDGSMVLPESSPRPFVDVFSATGRPVTETGASDHPHHLALSLALPDVDGVTYWGGRTFQLGTGSELLRNHGQQIIEASEHEEGALRQEIRWIAPGGREQLRETRVLRASALSSGTAQGDGILLEWESRLSSRHGMTLGSPATNGRTGAFYGGVFWRTPFGSATVLSEAGTGADAAHGSISPWLMVGDGHVSIVALAEPGLPWFVRTGDYAGFGPAVAVSERRVIAPDEELELNLRAAILDGTLDVAAARRWAELVKAAATC